MLFRGFLACLLAFQLQAQAPAAKVVAGEVTATDAAAKHFQVKGDDGVLYTVALQDNAIYLRMPLGETDQKKATRITFGDVAVGDRMLTRGAYAEDAKTVTARTVMIMTRADVAKKQASDRADWQARGITATVTAVSADSKEITVNVRGRDAATLTVDCSAANLRRYSPESVHFADAKPSSLAEMRVGDTARILGDKSSDGSHSKAEEIVFGSFQTVAGTVVSVDPAKGEVRITDLQSKKPLLVRTNQNSQLRRLDEGMATMLARRLRPGASDGAPSGASPGGPPPGRGGAGGEAAGGPPPGGRGPGRGGNFDLQQILDRAPQLALADLKKGDAIIISSSKGTDDSGVVAFSLVAGVEPFLAAAPRTAGQVNLGAWNLDAGGIPEQ